MLRTFNKVEAQQVEVMEESTILDEAECSAQTL